MVEAILATDSFDGLGFKGGLPWEHIPEDMAWFRQNTIGKTMVMGSATFASIGGKLPGRRCVVLTSKINPKADACYGSVEEVLKNEAGPLIVIGGAKTYRAFKDFISRIYFTRIAGIYHADIRFSIEEFGEDWTEVSGQSFSKGSFHIYER